MQKGGRGRERGVAAERDLSAGREPAQAKVLGGRKFVTVPRFHKGGLAEVHLGGYGLQSGVPQPPAAGQQAHGRWVALERASCKGINLPQRSRPRVLRTEYGLKCSRWATCT